MHKFRFHVGCGFARPIKKYGPGLPAPMNYDVALKVTSHGIAAGIMPITMAADALNDLCVLLRFAVKS